ncbi:hypothetical protein YC2023_060907 [Brassica napus]
MYNDSYISSMFSFGYRLAERKTIEDFPWSNALSNLYFKDISGLASSDIQEQSTSSFMKKALRPSNFLEFEIATLNMYIWDDKQVSYNHPIFKTTRISIEIKIIQYVHQLLEIAYGPPTTFRLNSDGCKAVRRNSVGIVQSQTAIQRSYIFVGNGHMVRRNSVGIFRRTSDDFAVNQNVVGNSSEYTDELPTTTTVIFFIGMSSKSRRKVPTNHISSEFRRKWPTEFRRLNFFGFGQKFVSIPSQMSDDIGVRRNLRRNSFPVKKVISGKLTPRCFRRLQWSPSSPQYLPFPHKSPSCSRPSRCFHLLSATSEVFLDLFRFANLTSRLSLICVGFSHVDLQVEMDILALKFSPTGIEDDFSTKMSNNILKIGILLLRYMKTLIEVLSICECKIEILTGKVEAVEQIVREGGSKTLPKPVHLLLYMCLSETKPLNVGLVPNLNPKEGKILYLLPKRGHGYDMFSLVDRQNVNVLVDWLKFDP